MLGFAPQRGLMRYLAGMSRMDKSHDISRDDEPTPCGRELEAPTDTQLSQPISHEPRIAVSESLCDHQRLIDDVRTRSGKPSGKVRCLECGSIFEDPYRRVN